MKRMILAIFLLLMWNPAAQAQAPYYQGKDEKLPHVPTIHEVMDKYNTPESGRRLVTVMLASGEFFRPHYGPPGIPPERVKILRAAYMKTMKDPAFLAEAKKRKLEITPTSGEEIDALITEVMSQPPAVIERMKKLLEK